MKNRVRLSFATALALVSVGAYAASNGTLGATSTGSVVITATGPQTQPQVLVTNMADLSITNSTQADSDTTVPGRTLPFCLVNTVGGAISLTLSAQNGFNSSGYWRLVSAGNVDRYYRVTLTRIDASTVIATSGASGSFTASIPASLVFSTVDACSGGNNVKLNAVLQSALPETFPATSYSDTVTIVATPN